MTEDSSNPTDRADPGAHTSQPRVRFAPAPTGYLHLGSARTALFNWLYARHHKGVLVLRIEDTDMERSRSDVIEQVLESLRWLGLDWDEGPEIGGDYGPYFQSERRQLHLDHAAKLLAEGKAYECYMSIKELDELKQKAIAEGKPFRYEGWHRNLSDSEIERFKSEGRSPVIRLRVDPPTEGYTVDDLIKGATHFPAEQIDDFILVRSDGTPSFHLANVVDDATMKISHVIRGEDHLTNTVRHQVLFEQLGYPAPRYAHLPMILGPDRSKLSKRHGAVSVLDYKEQGYLPAALDNSLALLGWSSPDGQEELSLAELVERFELDRCSHSGSIFDPDKTRHFNGVLIRAMSVPELADQLEPYLGAVGGIPEGKTEDLIALIQKDLELLADFPETVRPILEAPNLTGELLADPAMERAAEALQGLASAIEANSDGWERDTIKGMIKQTGKALEIKGKPLFFPVRAAMTGQLHGPSLDGIMALVGADECKKRIDGFLDFLASQTK